tara:strand:+ start:100 stop:360 length:261 start_codon:yes stop_codon:yes gene_type:complete
MRRILNDRVLNMVIVLIHTQPIRLGASMSFFKHVKLHEYDITDLGIRQACYDELRADGNNSDEKQLRILAHAMCEEFKDYMRPLFA